MIRDIVAHLKADSTIQSLCSGRVFSLRANQSAAYPLVLFRVTDETETYATSGNCGPSETDFLFESHAESYGQARTLDAAVKAALDGFRGQMGNTFVQGTFIDSARDGGQFFDDAADRFLYRVSRQVRVVHD